MTTAKPAPFVETFQFVEPKTEAESVPVPNHILQSKIYTKIQQNAAIKVTPSVVHFEGMEIGKTHAIKVSLCNVARDVIRMHIIPPQTKYFKIKYTKPERLVPGMTMKCMVEFTADEYRYYYDAIRIHCPGEDNIIIPIHAFPVMDASNFPAQIKFPQTALGQRRSHTITLQCHVPVDFEFELKRLQDDIAYTVEPMSGIVPASGSTELTITYAPLSYCTSMMVLQLMVSQFNAKPLVCNISGHCSPNMEATKMHTDSELQLGRSSKPVLSPLEKSRLKKMQLSKKSSTGFFDQFKTPKKIIEKEGLRFPDKIDTVHHVSNILIQTPGKMQLKELIEAEKSISGRQMKENRFDQAIRKDVYEERQNQLRWQVKLGDTAISQLDREKVLGERQMAWQTYRDQRGDPHEKEEKERKATEFWWRRTTRDSEDVASEGIQFDLYTNNPWSARHSATDRFAQTARKIILRNRAKKNLSLIKNFLLSWSKKQESLGTMDEMMSGKKQKIVPVIEPEEVNANPNAQISPDLSEEKVIHTKYSFFVPPDKKDEMAPDALNEVVTFETRVEIVSKVSYFDLQVPQQYRLLGYNEHENHLGYDYVEPSLARPLRRGAEEEIINLQKPHEFELKEQELPKSRPLQSGLPLSRDLQLEDLEKQEQEKTFSTAVKLSPPDAMFKPIEYPPLHIFNPTPGLQVFQSPAPYAETDPDYHLCPLPKYPVSSNDNDPHTQTQRQFLDQEDVIKGTMSWKKFPSQGLISLANTPTLTNVWVPRWTDPFSSDLLPKDVPPLQSGLSLEDVLEQDEVEDDSIQLTPQMVSAQFGDLLERQTTEEKISSDAFPHGNKMPSTNIPVSINGPVPREKREQELDSFLSRKSNRLGQKIQARIDNYNSLKTRTDLILK